MAKVVFRAPDGKVREIRLKQRNTMGRHPAQDIQILDRVVSKAHAVIEAQDEGFYLYDVGSRNGTVLNGQPLTRRTELRDGDEITLGSTSLRFEAEVPASSGRNNDRVTIQQDAQNTAIRRLREPEHKGTFLPEAEITDLDVLRRDYEKLRIALELNQEVGLEFDLRKLLGKILDKAFDIFVADRGVILVHEDGELVPRIVRSRHGGDTVDNVRISQTILREVAEEKAAVLSSDAMLDSRFSGAHSIILEGIRSAMSVPLLYNDELLGVIHLDTQLATGAFTEKDLQLLAGFARQAAVNIKHNHLLAEMEQNILARDKLNRLLSPHLVDEVLNGRLELKKGGDRRQASVIFSDIRGFTSATERTSPEEIVSMLNEYFEVMVEIIFRYEGTLDKFVGDEIMALWGAPVRREDHALCAVHCALDMFEALEEFNAGRLRRGKSIIEIGIGIATGEMIAGYMGSTRAMDYTVIGDTVNLGSRLCSAAGPGEILISDSTHAAVRAQIESVSLPPVRVKGKAEPVKLFRVLERRQDANPSTETHSVISS